VDAVANFARALEKSDAPAAGAATAARLIRLLGETFSPICPFILKRFEEEIALRPA
jgi:hypothetical protein